MKAKLPVTYTQEHVEERIQYLDMLALMALHLEFGFGAERLKRYYRRIFKLGEEYRRRYEDPKGPKWGRKDKRGFNRTEFYKLKKDLFDIGFDYDAIVNEPESEG